MKYRDQFDLIVTESFITCKTDTILYTMSCYHTMCQTTLNTIFGKKLSVLFKKHYRISRCCKLDNFKLGVKHSVKNIISTLKYK